MRVEITETKNVDAILAQMPIELREKQLRKALGRGVRVMAKEARRTAPRNSDDDDGIHIARSIRTETKVEGNRVRASAVVRGMAAAYSVALEYGHQLYAWGRKTNERVAPNGFYRRAADGTETEQNREIVSHLKTNVKDLAS